jgi:putative solute:sodium symporter small subunit
MSAAISSQQQEHWAATRRLMFIHLTIWFIFSYGVHWFAPQLNQISFMHFPLGFYMAAQGSLIVFVVQLFIFVRQQHAVDRKYGMAEEE